MNKKRFVGGIIIVVLFIGVCFFCTDPVKPDFGDAPAISNDKQISLSRAPEKDSLLYLIVTAEGTEPLSFQWYKNDTIISRSFSDSLKFEPLKLSDTGIYHCIVSNKWGSDTSKSATISLTPRFNVRYDGNNATGGTAPNDGNSYAAGATVTVLGNNGNLVKTGHSFAGWNTAANGSGTSYSGGDTFTMGSADVVLYVKWTTNPTYTVTYNSNGSSSGSVPVDANNYETGATVTVKGNTGSLAKTGATFAGWNTKADGTGTNYSGGDTFTMGSADVVLYAKWTTNPTYTVTYNGNSSTSGSVPVDVNNYETGATINVKGNTGSLAKTGATFAGWNTKTDGTGISYSGGDTFTMDSADVVLYAKWTTNPTYTVTYNGNGSSSGSVPVDANNYETGATVTVKGNTGSLAKTGATFAGWNTKADGTGTSYSGGDTFTMGSADVVLYAKWTTNPTYTVTYNGNGNTGGTVPTDGNAYEAGATVTVRGNTGNLVKTGHTFTGWNTAANGSGTSYAPGDTFAMGSANVILYARWTINTYVVRFNSNGGSPVDSQSVAYNNTATEPIPPTRNGYIFSGWYSDQALTVPFVFTTPIIATITLYAKWTPVYTVTYNGNTNTGGSVPVDSNKYTNGATATVLDNTGSLVKTGYTFWKWNTNAAGTGTDRTAGETFAIGSANVILYAKWILKVYTVTFNSQGGSAVASQTVNHGSYATQPTSPTRSGYYFDGWFKESACTNVWNFAGEIVTADVTLYAKWIVKDADGNIYTTITIGTQTWIVENLKTTRYNDGTAIPLVTDSAAWANLSTPGYCWYNNDINNKNTYGALYNWYTVNSGILAPDGWHVPDTTDWDTLERHLVANGYNWDGTSDTTVYNKIAKSLAAKTGWNTSSTPGAIGNDLTKNNKSGFSAFPGGCRGNQGIFGAFGVIGKFSYWWCTTDDGALYAYDRYLEYDYDYLNIGSTWPKGSGFSVRLVKSDSVRSK